jgi:hypothetical protein
LRSRIYRAIPLPKNALSICPKIDDQGTTRLRCRTPRRTHLRADLGVLN